METLEKMGKGAIRLSIPAKVAYDADAFRKSIHSLLDELGCQACFSGVDCYFTTIRDYIINPREFQVMALKADDPSPQPSSLMRANTLTASVSSKTSFNIDKIDTALKDIFDQIGCLPCCSGYDIFFQNQFDFNI